MANAADEQRIRALEVQNNQLQQQVDRLLERMNPRPKAAPAPVLDDGPRVSFPRSTPIEMPTIAQFEKLLAIVTRAHPGAVPTFDRDSDRREFFLGFIRSFERIANLRRTVGEGGAPVLNEKYDARFWADEAYRWLHERGTPAETMNGSFFCAAICAGDVAYSFGNRAAGVSAHLGLGFDGLTASTAAWHRVLESGETRAATAAPMPLRQNSQSAEVRYFQ
jgi:hypothetical protein